MLRENVNRSIREFLNTHKFANTDVDLMGNALSTKVCYVNHRDITFKNALLEFIYVILCTNQVFVKKGKCEILTCFTPSYGGRKDFEKDIRKVLDTMVGYIASFPDQKRKLFLHRIKYASMVIPWLRSMRGMNTNFSFKLYCCANILRGYIYRKELVRYLEKNDIQPKLLVTFCDVHICDYFITDYFNKAGIPTATLQHAVFDHINSGYANSFSISTYFLGISEHGKREYIRSGKDGSNYVVLGSLKYIGQNLNDKLIINNTGKFGIALSGVAFQEQNKTLIEYAKKLANDCSYSVLVRCHPALNPDEYERLIDTTCMQIDRSESLDDFSDKCDFCIMGSTNTFGDLIANGHLALRMVFDADVFEGIECFKFRNYNELLSEVSAIRTDISKVREQFNYTRGIVCAPGNIEDNYRVFFSQMVKKESK